VWQLPASGKWYEGQRLLRADTPLRRASSLGGGRSAIYIADLEPGQSYTLGLRYPADSKFDPAVSLFDRWPMDPQSKRHKLPMGPVVRTDPEWTEYRWRLGVSGRSQGNLAFVAVQGSSRTAVSAGPFRHYIYLVTPAVQPKNSFGTGATYLAGPSDLFLPRSTGPVQYIVEYPYAGYRPADHGDYNRKTNGNLIFNGKFRQGLQGWEMFSRKGIEAAADHVATGADGLRIFSSGEPLLAGVEQAIQRDVQTAGSLVLGMELRIGSSARIINGNPGSPAELSVCYLDTEGGDRCGDDAYRILFTTERQNRPGDGTVRVNKGQWFSFEDELMDLDPRPQMIKSVSISGGRIKGKDAWIRQVYLIERGEMK
jgi:hypothetical protein